MNHQQTNQSLRWLSLALILISTPACDRSLATQTRSDAMPDAADLSIDSVVSNYRTWKTINKEPLEIPEERFALCASSYGPVDSDPNGPHAGGFVNVYVNDVGRAKYINANSPRFARGSVIVKEKLHTKDATESRGLGIMIKQRPGYAPDSGDWEFAFVDNADDNVAKDVYRAASSAISKW